MSDRKMFELPVEYIHQGVGDIEILNTELGRLTIAGVVDLGHRDAVGDFRAPLPLILLDDATNQGVPGRFYRPVSYVDGGPFSLRCEWSSMISDPDDHGHRWSYLGHGGSPSEVSAVLFDLAIPHSQKEFEAAVATVTFQPVHY